MGRCENCIKYYEGCKDASLNFEFCSLYSPVKVTNKERLSTMNYQEAAIALSDMFRSINGKENPTQLILNWLESNKRYIKHE